MLITKLKIKNYKSFLSSDEIQFAPGFNVIVGENNSGKTSLLEVLSLRFENKPHKSISTLPYEHARFDPISQIEMSFSLEINELRQLLIDQPSEILIPWEGSGQPDSIRQRYFQNWYHENRNIECVFGSGGVISSSFVGDDLYQSSRVLVFRIGRSDQKPKFVEKRESKESAKKFLAWVLAEQLKERIYAFRAERFNVGQSNFGTNITLAPDASNLPEVLNSLQSSSRFDQYNELVQIVFPQIARISVRPIENNQVKIFVLSEPNFGHDYLAIPLQDGGTGIGQVLAILYVIFTSQYPRTIIIDEPQSFLHPGAVRRLFSILKQYPQHQYIVSTHSPIAITSANPSTILLIHKEDDASKIEVIDKNQTEQLSKLLKQVGASLSDVFGADNLLWVEGATEQNCFPLIWTRLVGKPLLGTVIVGVLNTGDFESNKQSERAFQIYTRLSKGQSLIPPAIGFVFDKEGRTQQDQDDLIRRSCQEHGQQTVFFTPRKMYENYLLDSKPIVAILSNLKDLQEIPANPINIEAVELWFAENSWNKEFFKPGKVPTDRTRDSWLLKVHGKRVLQAIFRKFLTGIEYKEVEHGEALTKWLLEHEPGELQEIADLLMTALHMEN